MHRDITDQRHAEDMLRHFNGPLSEADRLKDEFLATLAHEPRNPLAPMRNVLAPLRHSPQGQDLQLTWPRTCSTARSGTSGTGLDDLLDVSRITLGEVDLRRQRIDVSEALHAALETAGLPLQAASHELTAVLPDAPLMLDADPTRPTQIVLTCSTTR